MTKYKLWAGIVAGLATIIIYGSGTARGQNEKVPRKEALENVPVFMITNQQGNPVLVQLKEEGKQVVFFFFSPQDSESALAEIRKRNPTVGQNSKVSAVPLSSAYQLAHTNPDKKLLFQFEGSRTSIESARGILKDKDIPPVPLFFATVGENILTLEKDGQHSIPFFFEVKDLEKLIEETQKKQPNLLNQVRIQVTSLFTVIDKMSNPADPTMPQLQLVPSRSAFDYANKMR